jgi:hypothetical protein
VTKNAGSGSNCTSARYKPFQYLNFAEENHRKMPSAHKQFVDTAYPWLPPLPTIALVSTVVTAACTLYEITFMTPGLDTDPQSCAQNKRRVFCQFQGQRSRRSPSQSGALSNFEGCGSSEPIVLLPTTNLKCK